MSLDSHPENGGADNVLGFDHVPEGLDSARQEVLAPDLRLGNTILVAEKWVEVRIIHQPELPGDSAQVRGADEDGRSVLISSAERGWRTAVPPSSGARESWRSTIDADDR